MGVQLGTELWISEDQSSAHRFLHERADPSIGGVAQLVAPAAGSKLILVDAASLVVVDDGALVDTSDVEAIQLDDPPGAPPAMAVSAWQTNSTFLKFERFLYWLLLDDDAVGYIDLLCDAMARHQPPLP